MELEGLQNVLPRGQTQIFSLNNPCHIDLEDTTMIKIKSNGFPPVHVSKGLLFRKK